MYTTSRSSRLLLRRFPLQSFRQPPNAKRFLSTTPSWQRPRSWRNTALRLGLAGSAVYFYNTTDVFADERAIPQALESKDEAEHLPTVDALIAQRKQRLAQYQEQDTTASSTAINVAPPKPSEEETPVVAGSPEELEEEADQQGAFNPETGEINWDCPCLGGMAHGPCGEEFKAAFSCFVYSKEEPKGVDCIEKFKGMQECFRQHPDVYGAEFDEDGEEVENEETAINTDASNGRDDKAPAPSPVLSSPDSGSPATDSVASASSRQSSEKKSDAASSTVSRNHDDKQRDTGGDLVPKAWHDDRPESGA